VALLPRLHNGAKLPESVFMSTTKAELSDHGEKTSTLSAW
jgi:hypothetical protein